jgi:hypothetical protein
MAIMKTITSLWTETANHSFDPSCLLMQTLSVNLARQQQGNLHLVTDSFGREIAAELGWEFDSVNSALDKMPPRLSHIWAAGKLYASSLQTERHMQIDGDVLLFKPLEPEGQIFAQSVDNPEYYRGVLMQELIKISGLEPDSEAYNCGILGGDPEVVQGYTLAALDLCGRKLVNYRRLGTLCAMLAEQYFLGVYCRAHGLTPRTIFRELPTDAEAEALGYCHMQGGSKGRAKFEEKARARMRDMFPDKLKKFHDGVGAVVLAAGLR